MEICTIIRLRHIFVVDKDFFCVQFGALIFVVRTRGVDSSAPPDAGEVNLMVAPPDVSGSTVTTTSATATRTLADRFSDWINVRDHGAVGDDVTDDTVAIEAAISQARTVSGNAATVYWPPGDYYSASNINDFHKVTHVGPGAIRRGATYFYISPRADQTNMLYVTPQTGNNLNDGLDPANGHCDGTYAAEIAASWGLGGASPGIWIIELGAGLKHTPIRLPDSAQFEGGLTIRGPGSPGAWPEAWIEPTQSSQALIWASNCNNLILRNIGLDNEIGYTGVNAISLSDFARCSMFNIVAWKTARAITYNNGCNIHVNWDCHFWGDGDITQSGCSSLFNSAHDFNGTGIATTQAEPFSATGTGASMAVTVARVAVRADFDYGSGVGAIKLQQWTGAAWSDVALGSFTATESRIIEISASSTHIRWVCTAHTSGAIYGCAVDLVNPAVINYGGGYAVGEGTQGHMDYVMALWPTSSEGAGITLGRGAGACNTKNAQLYGCPRGVRVRNQGWFANGIYFGDRGTPFECDVNVMRFGGAATDVSYHDQENGANTRTWMIGAQGAVSSLALDGSVQYLFSSNDYEYWMFGEEQYIEIFADVSTDSLSADVRLRYYMQGDQLASDGHSSQETPQLSFVTISSGSTWAQLTYRIWIEGESSARYVVSGEDSNGNNLRSAGTVSGASFMNIKNRYCRFLVYAHHMGSPTNENIEVNSYVIKESVG